MAVVVTGQKPNSKVPLPSLDLDKIYVARENTNLMINTVVERNYSNNNSLLILDIPTILLTIIIRSEAHEYALNKILERIKEVTKNQIDIPDLLSVEAKVSKVNNGQLGYKPDTRAIRDATAHAKFKIESDPAGDFLIAFNNTDKKYSFQKSFSRRQLLQFYQDYDRMTVTYTRLLTVRSLHSFLSSNFVYN